MKRYLLTLPVAALMCGAAFAETGATSTAGTYGSTWSKSVGSMFYSDSDMKTMRTPEGISSGWATLSQEDRDAVMADCARYRTDSGTTAATKTDTAKTGTDAATGTDSMAGTETTTGTEGAAADDATANTSMSASADNMKMMCAMVEAY